ncbi:MAG: hypothetical protein SGILL_002420 [Bacillariaceae sp.]
MSENVIGSVIDLDEDWSAVDMWELSGIITGEDALKAEKNAEEAVTKIRDEEKRYELIAQAAKDHIDEMTALLENAKVSTATKEEMDRISKMNERMELLKSDVSESKSVIMSYNEDVIRSMSKQKTYALSNATKDRDIRAALNYVREAEAVDLAFILDCTDSMQPHIDAAKKSIKDIVSRAKHTNPGLLLRLALVGYRDISDEKRFEVLDFTSSIEEFEIFVSKLVADGGKDAPEDIAGALQKANALSWKQASRVVFLICDYPCHGMKFHDYPLPDIDDYYPTGTPGICIESELKALKAKTGNESGMNLHFGRITGECDTMIRAFKDFGIGFEVNDLNDPQHMTRAVTSSLRKSISRSVTASRSRSHSGAAGLLDEDVTVAQYEIRVAMPSREEWEEIPVRRANVICNKPVASVEDILAPLLFGVLRRGNSPSKGTETSKMLLQRAVNPFAEGESRLAYFGRVGADEDTIATDAAEKVFKEFKKTRKTAEVDRKQYLDQMEVSTVANFLAEEYNKTARPSHCPKIRFLEVIVVESDENFVGGRYCVEELLPTAENDFTRFSNNTGYWNEDEINQSLLLFTQFTFEKTGGFLMVTDLQGVRNEDEFILTDPAILCKEKLRFGETNLGEEFIKKCMDSTKALLEEYGWDD